MAAATCTFEAPGADRDWVGLIRQHQPGLRLAEADLAGILDTVAAGPEAVRRELLAVLRQRGREVLAEYRGTGVYYRGLLEFSNVCARDCHYCGIQASNRQVERFTLDREEVVATAVWCAENGYGSVTLQSGERNDPAFVDLVEDLVRAIKQATTGPRLPDGLGITLCVGEQPAGALRRFQAAGAHRYLLRVETTNPDLYARLHPAKDGSLADRVANLRLLKELGYQVGSGVMIGLPGQTGRDLARDLLFLVDEGVHMVGMGPYIPHADTPLARELAEDGAVAGGAVVDGAGAGGNPGGGGPGLLADRQRFELGLAMVSLCRLMLPLANIAATTALQALNPFGRELGLEHGANILMPLVTPARVRASYQLYDNKPCIDDGLDECRDCLAARVAQTRRPVVYDAWGDSLMAAPAGSAAGSTSSGPATPRKET